MGDNWKEVNRSAGGVLDGAVTRLMDGRYRSCIYPVDVVFIRIAKRVEASVWLQQVLVENQMDGNGNVVPT